MNNENDDDDILLNNKKEKKKNNLLNLDIKKSINSSELSDDSKRDEIHHKNINQKVNQTNVNKNSGINKNADLNTNICSKGLNDSPVHAPEGKLESVLSYELNNNLTIGKENTKSLVIEKNFIRAILCQHYLFKDTGNKIITSIIDLMEIETLPPNQLLYDENTVGDKFYIVKKGSMEETFKNKKIIYREGDTFGELALLEKRKREGTVISRDDVILYSLKGQLFRNIVQKINNEEQKERLEFLSVVPIFKSINKNQLNNIVLNMFTCSFAEDQTIIREGETGYSFFIIKSGTVTCESRSGVLKGTLQAKDYFGEYAV